MFRFLISGLLLASFSHGEKLKFDADSNKYDSVIRTSEELKAHEPVEEDEIYSYPNTNQVTSRAEHDDLGAKRLSEAIIPKYLLYTRKNLLEPQIIDFLKPDTVNNSNINPKVPLKFIIHGYSGKNNLTWVWNMKSALLDKEDLNVIVVDFKLDAKVSDYLQAAIKAEQIGQHVAVFFLVLKNYFGFQEKDLHVIGFSFGAHVAGYVGKKMQKLHKTRPGRITGLDPAGPAFENHECNVHLCKEDADYVDVVHTNADTGIHLGLGMGKSMGHRDFYPNGGKRQPGCKSTIKGVVADIFSDEGGKATCNHQRAVHLFTESILNSSSCEFTAYPCSDYSKFESGQCTSCDGSGCARMGYYSQGVGGLGTHYLLTTAEKPYCADLCKLTLKFGSSGRQSMGTITITFVSNSGQTDVVTMKTDDFIPGDVKVRLMPISNVISDLSHVLVLYQKYISFPPKSSSTYSLLSVTIKNLGEEFMYKSCRITPLILKDNMIYKLRKSSMEC